MRRPSSRPCRRSSIARRRCSSARALLAGALTLLLVLGAGCGGDDGGSGDGTVAVYVSVPLSGERAAEGRAIVAGVKEALGEARGRAGEVRIRAVYMDDTGGGGRWDMATAAANARRAVEDASAIAFIGDLDSGATRITLPITNQAEMLQISPGATARDLTRRVSSELEPGRYRPSDEQTFVRLVPSEKSAGICAAYGYEAMSLILEAVRSEGADRRQVIDAVLATEGRRSRIGTYSITEPGDIRFDNQNSDPCAPPAQP